MRPLAGRWGADRDGRRWVVSLELRRRPRLSAIAPVHAPPVVRRVDRRPVVVTCTPS